MKPQIEKIEAIERYKLFLRFADDTEGILDLSHLAGKGVFKAWDKDDLFFKVFVSTESGTVTWPGEIDIDIYNAYCKIKGITPEQYFRKKEVHAPHL